SGGESFRCRALRACAAAPRERPSRRSRWIQLEEHGCLSFRSRCDLQAVGRVIVRLERKLCSEDPLRVERELHLFAPCLHCRRHDVVHKWKPELPNAVMMRDRPSCGDHFLPCNALYFVVRPPRVSHSFCVEGHIEINAAASFVNLRHPARDERPSGKLSFVMGLVNSALYTIDKVLCLTPRN